MRDEPDDKIVRLCKIAASKCYIIDPAIDYDDLKQIAALSLLTNPELPPALAVLRARSRINDFRKSNQVKRRQEQETLSTKFHILDKRDQFTEIDDWNEKEFILNCNVLTKQQHLIVSDLFIGWTQVEISKRRGISLTGVNNQVSAAIRRLRKHFGLSNTASVRMGRGKASLECI